MPAALILHVRCALTVRAPLFIQQALSTWGGNEIKAGDVAARGRWECYPCSDLLWPALTCSCTSIRDHRTWPWNFTVKCFTHSPSQGASVIMAELFLKQPSGWACMHVYVAIASFLTCLDQKYMDNTHEYLATCCSNLKGQRVLAAAEHCCSELNVENCLSCG